MKIGITFASVYSEFEKDKLRAMDEIKASGYDYMEIARHPQFSGAEEFKAELDKRGLKAVSGHFGMDDFSDAKIEDTLKYVSVLGIDTLVMPGFPPGYIDVDYDTTVKTAKQLEGFAVKLKPRGYKVIFHNHDREFSTVFNGKCVQDIFFENTSLLGFELDIGWAYTGGCDVVSYIKKLGKRLDRIHIKDIHKQDKHLPIEIGEGAVDIKGCMDAAAALGIEYGIVEQDSPDEKKGYPPYESIRVSRNNLRSMGY